MDCIAAFESVGTYRGAAEICGVDPKTVKRIVLAHQVGEPETSERRSAGGLPRSDRTVDRARC
jgi:hypothetical protein